MYLSQIPRPVRPATYSRRDKSPPTRSRIPRPHRSKAISISKWPYKLLEFRKILETRIHDFSASSRKLLPLPLNRVGTDLPQNLDQYSQHHGGPQMITRKEADYVQMLRSKNTDCTNANCSTEPRSSNLLSISHLGASAMLRLALPLNLKEDRGSKFLPGSAI